MDRAEGFEKWWEEKGKLLRTTEEDLALEAFEAAIDEMIHTINKLEHPSADVDDEAMVYDFVIRELERMKL